MCTRANIDVIEVSHENGVWKREDEAWRKGKSILTFLTTGKHFEREETETTDTGLKRDCSEECPGNGDGAARLKCQVYGEPENKLIRKNGFRGISVAAVAPESRRH